MRFKGWSRLVLLPLLVVLAGVGVGVAEKSGIPQANRKVITKRQDFAYHFIGPLFREDETVTKWQDFANSFIGKRADEIECHSTAYKCVIAKKRRVKIPPDLENQASSKKLPGYIEYITTRNYYLDKKKKIWEFFVTIDYVIENGIVTNNQLYGMIQPKDSLSINLGPYFISRSRKKESEPYEYRTKAAYQAFVDSFVGRNIEEISCIPGGVRCEMREMFCDKQRDGAAFFRIHTHIYVGNENRDIVTVFLKTKDDIIVGNEVFIFYKDENFHLRGVELHWENFYYYNHFVRAMKHFLAAGKSSKSDVLATMNKMGMIFHRSFTENSDLHVQFIMPSLCSETKSYAFVCWGLTYWGIEFIFKNDLLIGFNRVGNYDSDLDKNLVKEQMLESFIKRNCGYGGKKIGRDKN